MAHLSPSIPARCLQAIMSFNFFIANHYNASLIALILETIVCSIYTLLCGYTVWRLLLRKSRYPYMFCLIILWLLTILTLPLDWHQHRTWFPSWDTSVCVDPSNSVYSTVWVEINIILSMLVMMIADALLIYRCYNVCGRRKWILVSLGAFLFADIVGACVEFIQIEKQHGDSNWPRYRPFKLSYFVLGFLLSSIVITGASTSLIICRILSATQGNPSVGSRAPYRRIQRVIIESGAIYLLSLVITVIPLALARYIVDPPLTRLRTPGFESCNIILTYSQAILTPLSGIAPTLISLRVVTQTPQTEVDDSPPASRLIFKRTVPRNHTPVFGSLVSSLHFESTWEVDDLVNGTSCVANGEEAMNMEGLGEGEQIRLEEV